MRVTTLCAMESRSGKPYARILIGILICLLLACSSLYIGSGPANAYRSAGDPKPTPRKARYTEFPHDAKAHRLDCGTCHKFPSANWNTVRTGTAAFPDIAEYPRHDSCVKCHMQQFFKGARPAVCSICHTTPGPRNSARHPFPNPREIFDTSPKGKKATSDFAVTFPHDKHIEIVSAHSQAPVRFMNASWSDAKRGRAAEESCSVCHQTLKPQDKSDDEYITPPPAKLGDAFWLKKGTFKSVPVGHATCFTCHSADAGMLPSPQTCSACHQLKPIQPSPDFDAKLAGLMLIDDKLSLDAWRRRDSAGTFRHEFFAHVELSCSTCHNVQTMNTADPATKRVPISACATCHATPTADDGGALNYEIDMRTKSPAFQCAKCHVIFGKLPVPGSHIKALEAPSGK